ncbi:MAG: hypothetical protein R3F56_20760 [Planctomycetota bacterium]
MRCTLSLVSVLSLASLASAQVVASDAFSYTGALTANGWVAHSGAGNKQIMSNGSYATLDQSAGSGEDVNKSFAPFAATDTIYASFRFRVPSGNPVNPDNDGLYFAHFKDSGTLFRARTGLMSPAAAGDFGLAINADNGSLGAGAVWPGDLAFDTWYAVVISWDASTGRSELWLDPTCGSAPSINHTGTFMGDAMEGFAFRQSNDYTGFIDVDDVVVGRSFADVLPGTGTFSVTCSGCAGLAQTASGSPNIGGNVYFSVPNATAMFIGLSNTCLPLCPAGCNLGTDVTVLIFGSQIGLRIPCNSSLVGGNVYSQGIEAGNGGCAASVFGVAIATSDTIRTTIGS